MLAIINAAAQAYRGVIPPDRWHEPYMPADELQHEIAAGVNFWVAEDEGRVVGVMGIQDKGDVALVRHAYVDPALQRGGVGTRLLSHVRALTAKPVLIGTWATASWAIDFYRRNGFNVVPGPAKDALLRKYWTIPARQIDTSVVLADARWREPLFRSGAYRARELGADDIPRLQRFYEANPQYFLVVNGRPAQPREAEEEFDFQLPEGWSFEKHWMLAFERDDGELVGMADVVSGLFSRDVWHIGLFIVATELHGKGVAHELHAALERWMLDGGARWIRLGVVAGNSRAERFWERLGYVEVRRRLGLEMGDKVNDLRVMVKPLHGNGLAPYLERVARDRPEAP